MVRRASHRGSSNGGGGSRGRHGDGTSTGVSSRLGVVVIAAIGGALALIAGVLLLGSRPSMAPVQVAPACEDALTRMVEEAAGATLEARPFRALNSASKLLDGPGPAACGPHPSHAFRLLSTAADIYAHMKMFRHASTLRRKALAALDAVEKELQRRKGSSSGTSGLVEGPVQLDEGQVALERVTQTAALATDLYLDFEYEEALGIVSRALEQLEQAQRELPPKAKSVLIQLQSTILECKGDLPSSLYLFEQALKQPGVRPTLALIQHHFDLLQRTSKLPDMPDGVRTAIQARLKSLGTLLISRGPWQTTQQLPRHFIPNLTSRPWHDVDAFAAVARAVPRLQNYTAALQREFDALQQQGVLLPERECILESKVEEGQAVEGQTGGGTWLRYESTAYWRPLLSGSNCSRETPVACEVMRVLRREAGLHVLRAGYSALGPGTVLKPHYGMTNGQLKLHLGLRVPTMRSGARADDERGDGEADRSPLEAAAKGHDRRTDYGRREGVGHAAEKEDVEAGQEAGGVGGREQGELAGEVGEGGEGEGVACAFLTVAGETRPWREGNVLFFDDSYLHSVRNACDKQRTVFQVVFAHPDLVGEVLQGAGDGSVTSRGSHAVDKGEGNGEEEEMVEAEAEMEGGNEDSLEREEARVHHALRKRLFPSHHQGESTRHAGGAAAVVPDH